MANRYLKRFILFLSISILLIGFDNYCYSQAHASFTVDFINNSQCAPAGVSFTNLSTGTGNLEFDWKLTGGNPGTSTIKSPSTVYSKCGTYTVKLTVTDDLNSKSDTSITFTIACSPKANFKATSPLSGCSPLDVQLINTSSPGSGTIDSALWDFGDGILSHSINPPAHHFVDQGCYNVTMITYNSYGCRADTVAKNFACVTSAPQARFTSINAPSACAAPYTINFTAAASTPSSGLTYLWNFGTTTATATSLTAVNPSVTYNSTGSFPVTLTVKDANGCTNTITINNYVNIAVNTASFTASASEICKGGSISFSGSIAPRHYWKVTPSTGVTPYPPPNFDKDITFTFADPGTYTICDSVIFNGGCKAKKCTTVVVNPVPTADFTVQGNQAVCQAPLNITVTNKSSPGTYSWSFPGGVPSSSSLQNPGTIYYGSCGSSSISLTVSLASGCSDSKTIPDAVTIDCPNASFFYKTTLGNTCAPTDTSFFDASASTGSPDKYYWNWNADTFPNNYQLGLEKTFHIYKKPGCYTVGLIIENAQGCRDTITHGGICLGSHLKACFSAKDSVSCAKKAINFTNCTNVLKLPLDTTRTFTWNFGDGETGFGLTPNHIYNDTGKFTVRLIACNNGCCDTLIKKDFIRIYPPLSKIITKMDCDDRFCRTFIGDSSMGADTYSWDIKPPAQLQAGYTVNSSTIKVCYPTTCTSYTIGLSVFNQASGCDHNTKASIFIRDLKANFSVPATAGCAPLKCLFNNTTTCGVNWKWSIYRDGSTTPDTTISTEILNYTFYSPGRYGVRLIATDYNGCSDTIIKNNYITVFGTLPDFSATPLTGCPPLNVDFKNLTLGSSTSAPSSYKWNFGDPSSGGQNNSTAKDPSHTFNNEGPYDIRLIVVSTTSGTTCYDTLVKPAYITVLKPLVDFIAVDTAACLGNQVCLVNFSTGNNLNYTWDFGDTTSTSDTSHLGDACYTYSAPGFYSVKLTAVDQNGCMDSLTKTSYIHIDTLNADFTSDTASTNCPPLVVSFFNTSNVIDNASTYFWDFGDNASSTTRDPQHIYTDPGDYTVKLTVSNHFGCVDSVTKVGFIHIGGPKAHVSTTGKMGCAPFEICFNADSSSSISYIWSFGDSVAIGDSAICHIYTTPAAYRAEVILNDGVGCVYTHFIDSIYSVMDTAFFRSDVQYLCGSGLVQFTDSSRAITPISYLWNFGDPASGKNDTSTLKDPSHFYADTGTFVVTLISSAAPGCPDTAYDTIRVITSPLPEFAFNNKGNCLGYTIQFKDSTLTPIPISSYSWDFGDPLSGANNTSLINNPSHVYNNIGSYNVKLVVETVNGCKDSITKNVVIHGLPIAGAGSDKAVCDSTAALLNGSGGVIYAWSPAATLNDSTAVNPIATPRQPTTYTVTVTDIYGCSQKDSVIVNVFYPFSIQSVTDTCICQGDQINLHLAVNGENTYHYKWSPPSGLSDPLSSSPAASPEVDTRYRVIVYDSLCYSDTAYLTVCVYALPSVNAGPDVRIYAGEEVKLNAVATHQGNFSWSPSDKLSCSDCAEPTVNSLTSGIYAVTFTDANGCRDEDTVSVFAYCTDASLFIPNAFTPNTDGLNDDFRIEAIGIKELRYLRIYNRWGELVFETNSLTTGWDGTYKGKALDAGVFVYYLEAVCTTGFPFTRKGNVTLLR